MAACFVLYEQNKNRIDFENDSNRDRGFIASSHVNIKDIIINEQQRNRSKSS